jgi:hypothetical protein
MVCGGRPDGGLHLKGAVKAPTDADGWDLDLVADTITASKVQRHKAWGVNAGRRRPEATCPAGGHP